MRETGLPVAVAMAVYGTATAVFFDELLYDQMTREHPLMTLNPLLQALWRIYPRALGSLEPPCVARSTAASFLHLSMTRAEGAGVKRRSRGDLGGYQAFQNAKQRRERDAAYRSSPPEIAAQDPYLRDWLSAHLADDLYYEVWNGRVVRFEPHPTDIHPRVHFDG